MTRVRDYSKEYREYQGTEKQKEQRAQRNAARREYEKKHGDMPSSVDVDHKRRIAKGGGNDPSNLRAVSEKKNSGWRKGKKGYDR
jgi:hypothetical protein